MCIDNNMYEGIIMSKIEFEFSKLNYYFDTGVIGYDPITKIEKTFTLDVLFDKNLCFWKQNCVKYEMVDETNLINHFKSNFDRSPMFLSSVVKGRLLEAYRQYGRDKFEQLQEIPKRSVVFNNALIYFGNNIDRDIQTETIKDSVGNSLIFGNVINNPYNYFFVTNPIPYDYIPNVEHKCPTIDKYFGDWVGEDKKEVLYELIAYCMLPDYPLHRIFILFGSGRNGKSRYMKILEKVIGQDNITASDIYTLTEDRFGTAALYKRLVCNLGETDGNKLNRTSIIKRLSGGDTINAQFKNKAQFSFENYAKIIMGTNTIPQMQDKTFGNMSRYIIIDFNKTFTETEDILQNIPEEEYQALANICIDKLKDLLARRKFTGELSPEQKLKYYEEKSNPLSKFIKTNCNLYGDKGVPVYEFFDRYVDWLGKNGYSTNVNKNTVILEVQEEFGIIKNQVQKTEFGESRRYYNFENISWKTEKTIKLDETQEIKEDKEFNSKEIVEWIRQEKNISLEYDDDYVIRQAKKAGIIYEPKTGSFKIQ